MAKVLPRRPKQAIRALHAQVRSIRCIASELAIYRNTLSPPLANAPRPPNCTSISPPGSPPNCTTKNPRSPGPLSLGLHPLRLNPASPLSASYRISAPI